MSLALHVEAGSFSELREKVMALLGAGGPALVVLDQVAEKPVGGELSAVAKKAGRPKKEESAPATRQEQATATITQPAPTPAPTSVNPFDDAPDVAPSKAVSLEDVRSALQEVAVKYPGEPGMDKVKVILAKFDTFKVSAVKPEKYQAVIDECKKA